MKTNDVLKKFNKNLNHKKMSTSGLTSHQMEKLKQEFDSYIESNQFVNEIEFENFINITRSYIKPQNMVAMKLYFIKLKDNLL